MRPFPHLTPPLAAAIVSCLAVLVACGGGGENQLAAETQTPNGTPFELGTAVTIRGQEVQIPAGATMTNQKPECQQEATALTSSCVNDLKMIARGNSYILFDPTIPRVIARLIEPEDDKDFRPLLGLISGTTGRESASPAPGS